MEHLPEEVLLLLFSYLTPRELRGVCLVSWEWHRLGEQDVLWIPHWQQRWPAIPLKPRINANHKTAKELFKERCQHTLPTTKKRYPSVDATYKMNKPVTKKQEGAGLRSVKATVVGSTGTGKTCLLISYTTEAFPGEYIPTVFDNYTANVMVQGKPINLALWDTHSDPEPDKQQMRVLAYNNTDVFIVCFSITQPESLWEVQDIWIPELQEFADEGVPILLVATKIDLRDDFASEERLAKSGEHMLTTEEGTAMAMRMGVEYYLECSALTAQGLREVFDAAIKIAISPAVHTKLTTRNKKEKKDKRCQMQ